MFKQKKKVSYFNLPYFYTHTRTQPSVSKYRFGAFTLLFLF